ncbi:hypothetical protein K0J45_17305 [Shewanella alkalitolerans]|uniref:hypothetical protein n=1 Tax=Shewanella alkalitolerans TaxID=2864209 RepID=UPI001C661A47|nr:hypothetical protein [Shewanella alkalitolerans]QYJ97244.1 hypothetical protein K0J45_17305 [Shewanella alkalitolerans]
MRLSFAAPTSWIALSTLLFSLNASAGIEQQLSQCAAHQDKLDRLICYDNLAAKVGYKSQANSHVAPVSKPAPAAQPKPAPQAAAVVASTPAASEASFGKVQKVEKVELDKVNLTVASVQKNAHGALTITFDNGQVWKQNDSRRFRLKAGDKVYIEKGALGSFLLGKEDANATIRVKRID